MGLAGASGGPKSGGAGANPPARSDGVGLLEMHEPRYVMIIITKVCDGSKYS